MPQADPAGQAPRPETARPAPRYRRQLRSRIILSFALLGFGLTLLLAFSTYWVRDRVENELVEDVLSRNIDRFAAQYARDPRAEAQPVEQMRAFVFTADRFDSVRQSQPDWYDLPDGIYGLNGIDEAGESFSYKLAVRKTPEVWFFLAYDMTEAVRGEDRFNRALVVVVVVFTALSLLIGWWAASRLMSPVSELAQRLKRSGRSAQPKVPTHGEPLCMLPGGSRGAG